MKHRETWIIIGLFTFISAPITIYVVSSVISIMLDLKRMEEGRPILLYETDHKALLEACEQVAAGRFRPGIYGLEEEETKLFPKLILDLSPLRVDIERDKRIDIIMSPVTLYGVCFFPDDYNEASINKYYNSGERVWAIELIEGLWYYDEDFLKHPEYLKEVEKLLSERKQKSSTQ